MRGTALKVIQVACSGLLPAAAYAGETSLNGNWARGGTDRLRLGEAQPTTSWKRRSRGRGFGEEAHATDWSWEQQIIVGDG